MKKIIILITLVVFSLPAFSQVFKVNATKFRFTLDFDSWSSWTNVNIPVLINFEEKRVIIYSKEKQIIDFDYLNKEVIDNCIVLDGIATDSNNKRVILVLNICEKITFLSLMYDDISYTYELLN